MSTQLHAQTKAAPQTASILTPIGLLQRKCACGQHTVAGDECEECRSKREGNLRCAAVNATPAASNGVPPIVHEVLNSPGQPLDARTRVFMEPRFGHDFSQVRVHTDSRAAESARAVNALAYTVGRDVVFGTGLYTPGTSEERRLLAHELTHVVQQASSTSALRSISSGSNLHEHEAERVTSAILAGDQVNIKSKASPSLLQRQEELQLHPPASQPMGQQRFDAFGKECPDTVVLADKKPIPSFNKKMFDAGFRTYLGLVTNMKVGPKSSYESSITEVLKLEEDSCGDKGNMAEHEPCGPKTRVLTVGETCGGDDLTETTFPCSKTTFIDLHRTRNTISLLGGTDKSDCKTKCLQRYGCGGKEIGRFYITRHFKASEFIDGKNKVPITVGTIEKETASK